MNAAFLAELAAKQSEFSKSEAKVANWILENSAEAIHASLQFVSSRAEVSEPTVIRFCRSMGLDGFRDLKTQLIASLQSSDTYLHHDVSVDDSASSAATKVLESSVNALVDLRKQIFAMPFDPAADLISSARQIVFVGLGASGHVVTDACHKFFRLGIPCVTALDTPTILQQASVCQTGDVIVAVSLTGTWDEMNDAMQIAKLRGAKVVAITIPVAPLAELSDLLFPCQPNEDTNVYTPMSSRLAQLTLLDALQVSVALSMGQIAEDNLRSAKAALTNRRSGVRP